MWFMLVIFRVIPGRMHIMAVLFMELATTIIPGIITITIPDLQPGDMECTTIHIQVGDSLLV